MLVEHAVAGGEVRSDISTSDLLRAMVRVSYGNPDAGWESSARRLIDLLMDGLRRPSGDDQTGLPILSDPADPSGPTRRSNARKRVPNIRTTSGVSTDSRCGAYD
jgi:hypothetical protein